MLTKSGRMVEGDYTHYDALGRRILVSDPSGGTLHYHYDATGNPVEQDKSGLIWSNTFNALNQPIETTASGGLVVWGKTISLLPATVTVNARTAQPWGPYWAATNIPFTPGTNSLNVLLSDTAGRSATQSIAFVAQDKRYAYDPNGNMITNGTYTYIWDDENRLVEVRQHGVCLQKNRYDGLGRRREKVEYVAGAVLTNRYLYHGWLVLAITDGSGEILETYTHGADLSGQIGGEAGGIGGLLSSTREAEEVFYHYDFNGNIVQITSSQQIPLASYTYSPFGEVLLKEGPFDSRYQFSTKEYDEPTAMNYYGYRFYNSELGRWINRDPLGDEAFFVQRMQGMQYSEREALRLRSLNPAYFFVANNPINYSDILGLDFKNNCNKPLWVFMENEWSEVEPGDTVTGETDFVSAGPDANGNCKSYKWIDCFDAEVGCDENGDLQDPKLEYVGQKNIEGKGWLRNICCASEIASNIQQKILGGWKDSATFKSAPPGCN